MPCSARRSRAWRALRSSTPSAPSAAHDRRRPHRRRRAAGRARRGSSAAAPWRSTTIWPSTLTLRVRDRLAAKLLASPSRYVLGVKLLRQALVALSVAGLIAGALRAARARRDAAAARWLAADRPARAMTAPTSASSAAASSPSGCAGSPRIATGSSDADVDAPVVVLAGGGRTCGVAAGARAARHPRRVDVGLDRRRARPARPRRRRRDSPARRSSSARPCRPA